MTDKRRLHLGTIIENERPSELGYHLQVRWDRAWIGSPHPPYARNGWLSFEHPGDLYPADAVKPVKLFSAEPPPEGGCYCNLLPCPHKSSS